MARMWWRREGGVHGEDKKARECETEGVAC